MKYLVKTTARAEADAREYHDRIAVENQQPMNAQRWLDGLRKTIESLASDSIQWKMAPESELFEYPIHEILYKSHRILYTVRGDTVEVFCIRAGWMQPIDPEQLEPSPGEDEG